MSSFIAQLHRGGAFAYLWRLFDKQSRYFSTSDPLPIVTSANVYVGVHPVTFRRTASERGRIEDVAAINCLFAEFDVKDYGSKDAIREHLEARAIFWPSIIVDSGGGLHCYWLIDEPHILRNDADRTAAKDLQARFVAGIGGDMGAKDLARVLRLPGTLNTKYNPARRVEVVEDNRADAIYTMAELREWVNVLAPRPLAPQATPTAGSRTTQPAAQDGIAGILATVAAQGEGRRNSTLYWGAHRLREQNIPQTDAEEMLTRIATAIGLDRTETTRTIASAYGVSGGGQ